jgi:transglutaminase-like putative cysteine protease
MQLTIHHETVYSYPRPVISSVNEVWLRPMSDGGQRCLSFQLTTVPESQPRPYTDYFGNTVYHFDVPEPHEQLTIIANTVVETRDGDDSSTLLSDTSPHLPLSSEDQDRWLDWLSDTPLTARGAGVAGLAGELRSRFDTTSALVRAVAKRVNECLRYESGVTGVSTTAEDALRFGAGVCQDYTHVLLSVCRALGIPARYVSGYLATGTGEEQRQQSHAWAEICLPVAGWIGFDPTNDRLVDGHYVRVAIGRDYSDVPPVRGAFSGPSGHGLDVSVYVLSDQQQ